MARTPSARVLHPATLDVHGPDSRTESLPAPPSLTPLDDQDGNRAGAVPSSPSTAERPYRRSFETRSAPRSPYRRRQRPLPEERSITMRCGLDPPPPSPQDLFLLLAHLPTAFKRSRQLQLLCSAQRLPGSPRPSSQTLLMTLYFLALPKIGLVQALKRGGGIKERLERYPRGMGWPGLYPLL
jgi:hypothetical protein